MASPEETVATALSGDHGVVDDTDEVADALLASARELMTRKGIRRLRMDEVAKRAGYGRATLYRRFATREELVWAVVAREVTSTLARIEEALTAFGTLEDKLVEAFAATVEGVHGHPLLNRLIQIEPDLLLPHLTTGAADVLAISRAHLVDLLATARAAGDLGPVDLEIAADMIVRLAHSLLLTPGGPIPIEDHDALRAFARDHLARPLVRLSILGT